MRRWRAWLLAGLVIWIVLVAWWAISPIGDSVPTGIVKNRDGALVPTTQVVQCNSPLSGSTKPKEPLPILRPPRVWARTPCELPHQNDRVIFAIDVVLVLGVVVILAKAWKPSATSPAVEDASTA